MNQKLLPWAMDSCRAEVFFAVEAVMPLSGAVIFVQSDNLLVPKHFFCVMIGIRHARIGHTLFL